MKKLKLRNFKPLLGYIPYVLVALYLVIAWVVNFIQFLCCDFQAPWKDEIIKGIGVFTGFGSAITVWF